MLWNPAAKATSAKGIAVDSIRSRAVLARWARASATGLAPTCSDRSRRRWRSLNPNLLASPGTPSRSTVPSAIKRMARATLSARQFQSGEPGAASGRQRLQARKPADCAAAAVA